MVRIPAAHARLLKRVFVCKYCGAKIRADIRKVIEGKVCCRRCKRKALRPKSKKK